MSKTICPFEVDEPSRCYSQRYHTRWMIRRDMPEVLQTELLHSVNSWSEQDFVSTLRKRNCIGMVAEAGERVVGYMVYELHQEKIVLLKMSALDNNPNVLDSLITKLLGKLASHRRTAVEMTVHELDNPLIQALARNRFGARGVERRAYGDSDGYFFEYRLKPPMANSARDSLLEMVPPYEREGLENRIDHLECMGWTNIGLWPAYGEQAHMTDLAGTPPGETQVKFYIDEFPEE